MVLACAMCVEASDTNLGQHVHGLCRCPGLQGSFFYSWMVLAHQRRARMELFVAVLNREAVKCHPFIVSSWGRVHPAAAQMLRALAELSAQRERSNNIGQRRIFGCCFSFTQNGFQMRLLDQLVSHCKDK